MRTSLSIAFILALGLVLGGCGGTAPNNAPANNTVKTNSNNPLETNKAPSEAVTNKAPTLTPVFKAYCEAWVKDDEAALRKVYSAETVKQFEAGMKEEKAKSLLAYLAQDKVSGNPCDVTNEEITGDSAIATIKSNKYPNGIKVIFVKENGEWKMTNRSPVLDNATKTTGANTAK